MRGLSEDLVIAPYATALALMVAPEKAYQNLQRLSSEGYEAQYGFYEAIDYTTARLKPGETNTIIRSFMAHHQGMSLLSYSYLLHDCPMQRRFEADPLFKSTILLLQERIPKATAFSAREADFAEQFITSGGQDTPIRVFATPDTPSPEVQLLSNGRYHVMLTNAGGGYSRWKGLAVTRWREDKTRDNWGTFCYLRDIKTGEFWSTAYQPTLKHTNSYEAIFSEGRVEYRGHDHGYDTHMEIAVSPEDDIELRRLRLTNRTRISRIIEITSYTEVVIAPHASDEAHPAFSNLFVQTEIVPEQHAILCTRRARSKNEEPPWMLHLMTMEGGKVEDVSYETDRARFIGRGNNITNPVALTSDTRSTLSGTDGSVLDPIVAIRYRITIRPEVSATINMIYGMADTKDSALNLVRKYQDWHLAERVFDLAWTHGQVLLRQLNSTPADALLFGQMASAVIYANAALRADSGIISSNHRGQSGLWGYAISGDLPIVLLQIEDPANISLVRRMVYAHAYWRMKGLPVDLVIWNEDHAGYRQELHAQIMGLITAGIEANVSDKPGGIFVKPAEQIAEDDRILIQTVARVIISDRNGSLEEQIKGRALIEAKIPFLNPVKQYHDRLHNDDLTKKLKFRNGLGDFSPDGSEYIIETDKNSLTPAPWVNVISNPNFGTVISESGIANTWSENAHEYRLTPWSNDSISDTGGEAFYLRDEESGYYWSPTPLPCRGKTSYITRHGFGYSVFEHTENDIASELKVFVAMDAAVKFAVLKLRNETDRIRKISATGYVEWVLGDLKSKSGMHILTEIDPNSGAIFARNPYNTEFSGRIAFFDVDSLERSFTCDRSDFIGRNGSLRSPAALKKQNLSGKVGAALDACAAIQVPIEMDAGQETILIFRLGLGAGKDDARKLINRFRGATSAYSALEGVKQHWLHTLRAVNVETPDRSLNAMVNGWLLYQTLVCRLWARTATYQSGGAFGFRDQLQDIAALIISRPHIVRDHLLLSASRQFIEGDAQHWWHPPTGRGVRTRCSDDYLWLPLTTSHYVLSTGDTGVLNEKVTYLQGRLLGDDEESYYDLPGYTKIKESLFEHCVRAIEHSFRFGIHGLPLMGSGDWNDGMNLVGEKGEGESIWLGFFLYEVLTRFSKVASLHGDDSFAEKCLSEADKLKNNIELNGWDGEWYLRAYFDDGAKLGTSSNTECQIDSLAQSWSVLSGAGEDNRARQAMKSLDERLVKRDSRIIQLLDPPFDKSDLNPGYIKGYVPGVRENGGQYTHAAIWATMAFAKLGDSQKAWELLEMINPANHGRSPEEVEVYKVEPYVVAADVYGVAPHTGRGGWTWYTGSAAWMYRLVVESLLGLKKEGNKLHINPCLPHDWKTVKIRYFYLDTTYHITILQYPDIDCELCVRVDSIEQKDKSVSLINDQKDHWIELIVPNPINH
jgi:cellobiose phosphorylase